MFRFVVEEVLPVGGGGRRFPVRFDVEMLERELIWNEAETGKSRNFMKSNSNYRNCDPCF
jgi:hypothetical protein